MGKIILDCQNCGGTLEVTDDMEIFQCQYCKMPYLVERSGGSVRITQLEARVAKVEDEQEQIRLDLVVSRIQEVRGQIDLVYEELSSADVGKEAKSFRESSSNRLYEEELELRQEYLRQGGENIEIIRFVNMLDVLSLLQKVFPKWKFQIWFGREKAPLFGTWKYCPGVRRAGILYPDPLVLVMRLSDEVKVKGIKGRYKKELIALLQEQYPQREIK